MFLSYFAFVSFLADLNSVIVERDSSNTKRLIITIMDMPRFAPGDAAPVVVFTLRCVFDDHVRCMTACQVGKASKDDKEQSTRDITLSVFASAVV